MPSLTERWGPPVGAFFYLAQPPSPPRTTAHPATSPTSPSPPRATRARALPQCVRSPRHSASARAWASYESVAEEERNGAGRGEASPTRAEVRTWRGGGRRRWRSSPDGRRRRRSSPFFWAACRRHVCSSRVSVMKLAKEERGLD